jgi:murein L,D-transpeptidase YcbB/YkuD
VTNGTGRKWPVSQDTLTTGDLEPVWRGPAVQAEMLPMPRKDPRRKA